MFCMIIFMSFFGVALSLFGIDSISSFTFYSIFILIYAWFVLFFVNKIKKDKFEYFRSRDFMLLSILLLSALIALATIVVQTPLKNLGFKYLRKYIICYTILMFIFLVSHVKATNWIFRTFIFSSIPLCLLAAISFFSGIGKHYANETSKNLLRFTYSNPNGAGLVFSTLMLSPVLGFIHSKKYYTKMLFVIPFAFFGYLVYLTGSRNSMFALVATFILFTIFILFDNHFKKDIFRTIVSSIIPLIPFIISGLYIILVVGLKIGDHFNIPFIGSGKNYDSRILTWTSGFQNLYGYHFIFGNYYEAAIESIDMMPAFQNFGIDLIVQFGLVPSMLNVGFLCLVLFNKMVSISKSITINQICSLSLFCFVFFSSVFETGLFSAMGPLFVFGFSFLGLCEPSSSVIVSLKTLQANPKNAYYEINI